VRSRVRLRASVGIGILTLALAAGCAPPAPPKDAPNLLLIVADTLRADRLGCYGSTRGLTPFLDELATRSTVFHRAYAQSSWTEPSVGSLFTSRFPGQHGATFWHSSLAPGARTLAEVLHAHAYDTGGWSGNSLIAPRGGFARGFDYFHLGEPSTLPDLHNVPLEARADQLVEVALAWLSTRNERYKNFVPAFVYFQFMEPHYPYAPDPDVLKRVSGGRDIDLRFVNANYYYFPRSVRLEDLEDVYDASVAMLDDSLRRLFDGLAERHFLENAVVLVTADHGEEFDDHGGRGHGSTLYDELIRVPLLVHLPGQSTRRDVDDVASLVDVAPTLLELAGIPSPPGFEGRSLTSSLTEPAWWDRLRAAVDRTGRPDRLAFSELWPKTAEDTPRHDRAIVDRGLKLIVSPDGSTEVYDLSRDPGEKAAAVDHAGERKDLEERLDAFTKRVRVNAPESPPALEDIDKKTRERLKVLGYAG
jgi:arylsulfatase A-like enzyme